MTKTRTRRTPHNRTGQPVRPGAPWRIVHLACGHPQRDRIARAGDHVWCDACSDFRRVSAATE
jgi:hypothetical protein